ncbi:MAG: methyltransferase domain-containing protein [Candidatus Latescibacteria bacterium]|nr:methyltransferase domain-containing protein [Candidatus Latescibacterota bacterium]
MKYYFRENVRRYEKMTQKGLEEWAQSTYGGTDLHDFSSRPFLEKALPRLRFATPHPTALELGTGVGPGALFLADRGYQVTGYELIPEAVEAARKIAAARGLAIHYEVMDVTQIPHQGEQFDMIVDSFCINHIVFAQERQAVFESVKARLKPEGYYLVSSSVYESSRHAPDKQIVDEQTGQAYDIYDGDCLYEPETDYFYEPLAKYPSERERSEAAGDTFVVNGETYIPKRCYRDGKRLRAELESYGFEALWQQGEYDENLVCVHQGSGVGLDD